MQQPLVQLILFVCVFIFHLIRRDDERRVDDHVHREADELQQTAADGTCTDQSAEEHRHRPRNDVLEDGYETRRDSQPTDDRVGNRREDVRDKQHRVQHDRQTESDRLLDVEEHGRGAELGDSAPAVLRREDKYS